MEVVFQCWHSAGQEAAVLADGVAAHGGFAFGDPLLQEFDGIDFSAGKGDGALAHPLG